MKNNMKLAGRAGSQRNLAVMAIRRPTAAHTLETASMTGYLLKRAEMNSWTRRWCVLSKSQILCFKSPQESEPVSIVLLTSQTKLKVINENSTTISVNKPVTLRNPTTVPSEPKDAVDQGSAKSFRFELNSGGTVSLFAVENADEAGKWIGCIQEEISKPTMPFEGRERQYSVVRSARKSTVDSQKNKQANPDLLTVLVSVKGMHSSKCADELQYLLSKIPGVIDASVSLSDESFIVKGTDLNVDVLLAAVEDAGFIPLSERLLFLPA